MNHDEYSRHIEGANVILSTGRMLHSMMSKVVDNSSDCELPNHIACLATEYRKVTGDFIASIGGSVVPSLQLIDARTYGISLLINRWLDKSRADKATPADPCELPGDLAEDVLIQLKINNDSVHFFLETLGSE